MYELKMYGVHMGEFEYFKGSFSQLMKAFYSFTNKYILWSFTFDRI